MKSAWANASLKLTVTGKARKPPANVVK